MLFGGPNVGEKGGIRGPFGRILEQFSKRLFQQRGVLRQTKHSSVSVEHVGNKKSGGGREEATSSRSVMSLLGAIDNEDLEGVQAAIKSGADANATFQRHGVMARSSATPVIFRCIGKNVRILKALIDAGADVNAIDWRGRTVLHELVHANGAKDKVRLLRVAGADWLKPDNQGQTPIELAIHCSRGYLLSGDQKLAKELKSLLGAKHGLPA